MVLNLTPFPELETSRLYLTKLEPEDAEEIFLLRSDKEVNRYLDRPPAKTLEDAYEFIAKINDNVSNNKAGFWKIKERHGSKLIGTICLYNIDLEKGEGEIGYEMLPSSQGKGFMKEALAKLLEFAFEKIQLKSIVACCDPNNLHSVNLLSKFNFVPLEKSSNESEEGNDNTVCYILKTS